jgi:glycosyltransferase involved in cell wall biosynthesis
LKKIAIIDPIGGKGGMDFYDYGLSIGLSNNDQEVFYFTCNQTNEIIAKDVNTIFSFGDIWFKNKIFKLFLLLNGYRKSFKFCKKNKIEIVHFQFFHLKLQNILVLQMAKYFGLIRIVTLHDIDSFRGKESSLLQQKAFSLSQKLIVHNEFSFDEIVKKGISKNKVAIIPHGNYIPFVEKVKTNDFSDTLNLLFFGQIKEVKGLDILINAFAKSLKENENIRLTIAGKPWGTTAEYFTTLISKLKIEKAVTTNFSYIPNEEIHSYFQNSDVVVLPYKKIYQSGVLLLSMSYGRVCLCSDLDAFKEIVVDNETGYIFENNNVDSLSKKILEICQNKTDIARMEMNAQELLKTKFDWNNIAKLTKELYETA